MTGVQTCALPICLPLPWSALSFIPLALILAFVARADTPRHAAGRAFWIGFGYFGLHLWWLGAFLTLMLVYWSTFRTQVPLYLSNAATLRALVHVLPEKKNFRFVDLGCGVGSVLKGLAHLRGNGDYHGMETAPLPCLAAWWRLRGETHCHVHRRDFWKENLASYDVVYAFLSPAPMPRLWEKASHEMRPGSLFVSNRFIVPGVAPHQRIATQ